jgi:hypothetical protein
LAGNDDIVAARADELVVREIGRASDRFANVQQLTIPPDELGEPATLDAAAQPLEQLFAVHVGSSSAQ